MQGLKGIKTQNEGVHRNLDSVSESLSRQRSSNRDDGEGRLKLELGRCKRLSFVAIFLLVLVMLVPTVSRASAASTTRVSVSSSGGQANSPGSSEPAISGDGRYVAFISQSSNLVAGDTNGMNDVFAHDRNTGVTERLPSGIQGNGDSYHPSVSRDGRYVAFYSSASNFDPADTNNAYDVFVSDLIAGTITRVSTSSSGQQANGSSFDPAISADGNFVLFYSDATNLVSGDTNTATDVFVKNLSTGNIRRASVSSNGGRPIRIHSMLPSLEMAGMWPSTPALTISSPEIATAFQMSLFAT